MCTHEAPVQSSVVDCPQFKHGERTFETRSCKGAVPVPVSVPGYHAVAVSAESCSKHADLVESSVNSWNRAFHPAG